MFSLVQFFGLLTMVMATVFANFGNKSVCEPLFSGSGPKVFPDTPEAFQAYTPFSDAASSAVTPPGYVQSYSNLLTTYDEPSQFVHYMTMDSYDVDLCAAECDNDAKCNAFTIFFERQPAHAPHGIHCPNPESTTYIKCDLWSGTILPNIAINEGQTREDFHVVMAGANAYVKDVVTPDVPAGYALEAYALGAAIEAPLDCNGEDTYMGMRYWQDGKFDAQRCITACEETNDASGRQCHFVNTYMQRRNNVPVVQHCAMFSKYWPIEFATNVGQLRGNDEIDISETDSYGIRHIVDDFAACLPSDKPTSVASSTLETKTRAKNVLATPSSSSSFDYPIIAPETFSDWDPVMETTTYTTPTATASSFTTPIIAPETFSDWDPEYETATFDRRRLFSHRRQLVRPTGTEFITDVPDFASAFSAIPAIPTIH
ncbi:uncharacterized protein J4E88_000291 [Alternaria novae-zelandiae]|uniref:uncharacterized protein n=1 Tax=Alternaria novae-zelandiae TaxID=430562 RepID=UPI0020C3B0B3|nr:uncharacterized protein J4E88_000291 [Alternaria novae-zelandiae]KAI4696119.1 hypothetical protein J4E88_000291 [Alternaria novae-zelandiae]